jgi:hypothetical protein
MNEITNQFVELVRLRSEENRNSLELLYDKELIGNCMSILRQELDTFIRIIYLGRLSDMDERHRLMKSTLDGDEWKVQTVNKKWKKVIDKDMVDYANELFGYIRYVYKFGCGFIHLSINHNYKVENPFDILGYEDKINIKQYLHQYHNYPIDLELNIKNFKPYIPNVFSKISDNMLYHNDELKEERVLVF